MSKEISKPNQSRGIAKDQALWLLNLANGRIFPWSPLLAVRKGFVDCTADGKPINPKDVPGNHPWIREATLGVRDRMAEAGYGAGMSKGSVDHMLADFGRQLTDDAAAKYKQLEYERANRLYLESRMDQYEDKPRAADQVGATIRIDNKIDAMVKKAKAEIYQMAFEALVDLGLPPSQAHHRLIR